MSRSGSSAVRGKPAAADVASPQQLAGQVARMIRRYWDCGLHGPPPGSGVASLAEARTRRLRSGLHAQLQVFGDSQAERLAEQCFTAAQRIAVEEWRRDRARELDREAVLYCLREELLEAWPVG